MPPKAIAKSAGSCPAKIQSSSPKSFDLRAELQRVLQQNSIPFEDLARHVGCEPDDIDSILTDAGRFEILARVMDALKVDLTGIKPGIMLHQRLKATRESRNWSIERLAERSGLPAVTIAALERGRGSVGDLLTVLKVLGPRVCVRSNPLTKDGFDKDSRFTPKHIVEAIESAFGKITFDPCAHQSSPVQAARQILKEAGADGLTQNWSGKLVFVNPPYSGSSPWLRKVIAEWQEGNTSTLLCLSNAKTDASEFHAALNIGASVFFFKGRLKYAKPDGTHEPSSQASMMIAFGTKPGQREDFAKLVEGSWHCNQI